VSPRLIVAICIAAPIIVVAAILAGADSNLDLLLLALAVSVAVATISAVSAWRRLHSSDEIKK
jgi:hypothetical protein